MPPFACVGTAVAEHRHGIAARIGGEQRFEQQPVDEDLEVVPASSGLRFFGSSPIATRSTPGCVHEWRAPWYAPCLEQPELATARASSNAAGIFIR